MVERGPEKAGVGGSIPSLATTLEAANYADIGRRPNWSASIQKALEEWIVSITLRTDSMQCSRPVALHPSSVSFAMQILC